MLSNCSAKTSLESFFRSETKFSAQYCEVYLVMYLCNINSADHNRYFRGLKYSGGRFGRGHALVHVLVSLGAFGPPHVECLQLG